MEQKCDKTATSKDAIEKLMALGEEDLFAILGLDVLLRVDSGIQRKDYRKSEPNFYQDKAEAEKIVGESVSDGEWNELLYMDERVTVANGLLKKRGASHEKLEPKNLDKGYNPNPKLLHWYAKLVSTR